MTMIWSRQNLKNSDESFHDALVQVTKTKHTDIFLMFKLWNRGVSARSNRLWWSCSRPNRLWQPWARSNRPGLTLEQTTQAELPGGKSISRPRWTHDGVVVHSNLHSLDHTEKRKKVCGHKRTKGLIKELVASNGRFGGVRRSSFFGPNFGHIIPSVWPIPQLGLFHLAHEGIRSVCPGLFSVLLCTAKKILILVTSVQKSYHENWLKFDFKNALLWTHQTKGQTDQLISIESKLRFWNQI